MSWLIVLGKEFLINFLALPAMAALYGYGLVWFFYAYTHLIPWPGANP